MKNTKDHARIKHKHEENEIIPFFHFFWRDLHICEPVVCNSYIFG